jgi:hypothetical protein
MNHSTGQEFKASAFEVDSSVTASLVEDNSISMVGKGFSLDLPSFSPLTYRLAAAVADTSTLLRKRANRNIGLAEAGIRLDSDYTVH